MDHKNMYYNLHYRSRVQQGHRKQDKNRMACAGGGGGGGRAVVVIGRFRGRPVRKCVHH